MRFKETAQKSAVIIGILLLSVLCGYVYQLIGHSVDVKNHPREYESYVRKYSAEYGVPEYIVYAVILNESGFESNRLSDDGRIGLMQIEPSTFKWLTSLTKETLEPGILYDPETNIKYGTYMMSYLYTKYNRWKTVVAIMAADEATVVRWMSDDANTDEHGNLTKIPDKRLAGFISGIENDIETYRELYYSE